MTLDVRKVYREAILDHNRKPRNFRKLEGANCAAEGYNPLCGDKMKVYLKIEDNLVNDITFEGTGCAISIASASMMTECVKGRLLSDVQTLFEQFHALLTSEPDAASKSDDLGKLAVFAGVREFPIRVKCATLPWHTCRAAIENRTEAVSSDSLSDSGSPVAITDRVRDTKEQVIEVLRTILDPELPVNIYDLGLIYGLAVEPSGAVAITMTLTAPGCPAAWAIVKEVETKVNNVSRVTGVTVNLVWDPPWSQSLMSESARIALGLF